jgi:CheY-like chemotaxis protein
MIFYKEPTNNCSSQHPDRGLASVSDTGLQVLPRSVSMLEQGGNTADDKDAVPVSPRRSQPREARSRRRRRAQPTILVVDDEEPVREAIVEMLSIQGYRVITAASVGDAEEAKQRLGVEGIHLVITDVHLTPGRQLRAGYALAQRWRMEQPRLPIILMSGDPSNQDVPEVRDGSLRFLLKPFRMEVFLEVVREALGR